MDAETKKGEGQGPSPHRTAHFGECLLHRYVVWGGLQQTALNIVDRPAVNGRIAVEVRDSRRREGRGAHNGEAGD